MTKKFQYLMYSLVTVFTTIVILLIPFLFEDIDDPDNYEEYTWEYKGEEKYDFIEDFSDTEYIEYTYITRNQNILFVGTADYEVLTRAKAAVCMLLSVNTRNKTISVYQFNPYTLIDDGNTTIYEKFVENEDFHDNIAGLQASTRELLTIHASSGDVLVPIDDYIVLSADSFKQIISAGGNVEFELKEEFAAYCDKYISDGKFVFTTGQDALDFIRTGSVEERTRQQKAFMEGFFDEKLEEFNASKIFELYDIMFDETLESSSNLSKLEFAKMCYSFRSYDSSNFVRYSGEYESEDRFVQDAVQLENYLKENLYDSQTKPIER